MMGWASVVRIGVCVWGLIWVGMAVAQTLDDPPVAVQKWVPAGFEVLQAQQGDLNGDAYPDVVLALRQPLPAEQADGWSLRPLLLLLGQPDGQYRLAARNDHVVMCAQCGGMLGDPFTNIRIKRGHFSVEHYGGSGWRWTHIITFQYRPKAQDWYLYREGGDSYHVGRPDEVTSEVQTPKQFGQVRFVDYQPRN